MKVKDTVLTMKAIQSVKPSLGYTASFKAKVLRLAVYTSANHAAIRFGVEPKTVRNWLRAIGLESAINGYYFKG